MLVLDVKKRILFFILLMMILLPISVRANIVCNDGTVSPSCGDCHRGCCSHHGGCSSSGSSNTNSNSNNQSNSSSSSNQNSFNGQITVVENPKSADATLKEVTVDYEKVDISDSMIYTTKKDSVIISVLTNDDKATVEYTKNPKLNIGDNLIDINVTAENGDIKKYKLNIVKEKLLSSNKNVKIIVNDKEVIFNSFKSEKIYLSNYKNEIDIKYELEDSNAKAEIIGNFHLKVGKNQVIVKVTAENGETQDYIINVEKENNDTVGFVSILVVIAILGCVGFLIYHLMKKFKN